MIEFAAIATKIILSLLAIGGVVLAVFILVNPRPPIK